MEATYESEMFMFPYVDLDPITAWKPTDFNQLENEIYWEGRTSSESWNGVSESTSEDSLDESTRNCIVSSPEYQGSTEYVVKFEPSEDHGFPQQQHSSGTECAESAAKDSRLKRPMNSFMLFSNQMRPLLQESHPDCNNNDISKLLGQLWKELPEAQKKPYVDAASEIKRKFQAAHPRFEYRKRTKSTNAPNTERTSKKFKAEPLVSSLSAEFSPASHAADLRSPDDRTNISLLSTPDDHDDSSLSYAGIFQVSDLFSFIQQEVHAQLSKRSFFESESDMY